ncbi:hypothetical protein Q6247_25365, partial [Klebsiella pneumoniae]
VRQENGPLDHKRPKIQYDAQTGHILREKFGIKIGQKNEPLDYMTAQIKVLDNLKWARDESYKGIMIN